MINFYGPRDYLLLLRSPLGKPSLCVPGRRRLSFPSPRESPHSFATEGTLPVFPTQIGGFAFLDDCCQDVPSRIGARFSFMRLVRKFPYRFFQTSEPSLSSP